MKSVNPESTFWIDTFHLFTFRYSLVIHYALQNKYQYYNKQQNPRRNINPAIQLF
jgi:hypothetical protein